MASKRILSLDPNNPDDQALAGNWQAGDAVSVACSGTAAGPFKLNVETAVETHTPAEAAPESETPAETAAPTEESDQTPIAAAKSKTGNPAVDGMME